MAFRIRRIMMPNIRSNWVRSPFTRTMGSVVSCRKKEAADLSGGSPTGAPKSQSMSISASNDAIEEIVCSESEVHEGSIRPVDLQGNKILLVKSNGVLHAIGSKCTHYGLPLEKGSLCNGRIRCPFHGACFSLKTGDIEDFPGLDSLPKFEVNVVKGEVKVSARRSQLESNKRVKELTKRDSNNNQTYVVVGGGAAGAKCVETLRQEGFSGNLIMLTAEESLPYDRPKLSKAMHLGPDSLALRTPCFYQEADVSIKLGSAAKKVDTSSKQVTTSAGETIGYDKLFLATGGQPRELSVPGSNLKNVFLLRDPKDANAIVESSKAKKVVVIGTSFIGMETAAYLASENRSSSVTVVGSSSRPFERTLGPAIGERIQRLFEEKGVDFINEAKVMKLEGTEFVEKVVLLDGKEIPAEVVVAGIGVIPATGFLMDSNIALNDRGYVLVNKQMKTNVEDVYCGGDIAAFPLFLNSDESVSIGHWQMAHAHGHAAALNMMDKNFSISSVPFFWTVLFGKSLRYTGYGSFDDVIIGGDLEELTFIAYFCRGNKVVGVASLGKDPAAANYANYLHKGRYLTQDEVLADREIALHLSC